jgi:DNA transposition AAA+ family ATPase
MSLQIVTPAPPDRFAQTTVSRQIEDAVEFATMTDCAVGVRGRPGIGKSSTIGRLLKKQDAFVAAFEIPAGAGTQRNIIKWAMTALDAPAWGGQHVGALIGHLLENDRLKFHCLVVDEIQNADAAAIRVLLSLNEHAGLPLVMVGNEDALKSPSSRNAAWEQISDRVTKIVELETALAKDAEAIARAWGATLPDTLKVVLAFAETHSLRKVVQLLKTARALAAGGDDLTVANIELALGYLRAPGVKRGEAA